MSFHDIVISYTYTHVCLCVCMFAIVFLFICALERGNKEKIDKDTKVSDLERPGQLLHHVFKKL